MKINNFEQYEDRAPIQKKTIKELDQQRKENRDREKNKRGEKYGDRAPIQKKSIKELDQQRKENRDREKNMRTDVRMLG